jgi:hypothetical protein
MIFEGSQVSYTGLDGSDLCQGDQGRVLSVDGAVAHVMWTTGTCASQVSPVYDSDLISLAAVDGVSDSLQDSLDVSSLVSFSVRQTFDSGGEVAVLNEMAEAGSLAVFGAIAEDALALVTSRIRADAAFHTVVAELDEDEAESVLRLASICLVRDAFADLASD